MKKLKFKKTEVRFIASITVTMILSGNLFIPIAHAADHNVTGYGPTIFFRDDSHGGASWNDWKITASDGTDNIGSNAAFMVIDDLDDDNADDSVVLSISHPESGSASYNSIVVDPLGDISLADDFINIFRDDKKVGIGTTTPTADLEIYGQYDPLADAGFATLKLSADNYYGKQSWKFFADGYDEGFSISNTTLAPDETAQRIFKIESGAKTNALVIDQNSNIGIGTSNPSGQLHIFGGADKDIFSGMGPDLANGPAFNYGYGGASFGIGAGFFNVRPHATAVAPNPSLRFATANITKMIITNTGDVGIGTNFIAPASKLHVNGGDIRVTGGSFIADGTTLSVPDYVFEDKYKLMPLNKLKDFITKEKHLPGVKSAIEVKKRGLNISLTQMGLLKKVEELTLYTIQQQEELDDKNKVLSQQGQRINKLELMMLKLSSSLSK